MDDLLKEAIADAKAVRETALANAKMALEEAFTPKLKSMLSKKIQSEIDMDEQDDEEAPEEEEPAEEEGEEEAGEEEAEMEEEDLDLEAILKELEAEITEQEAGEEGEEEVVDDLTDAGAESDSDLDSSDVGDAENKEPSPEASDSSDAGQGSEEPADGGEEAAGEEGEEEVVDDLQDEDIDLEEILKALTEDDEEAEEEDAEALKNELEEHRKVVRYLRSKLNEVNLLNAKLLFTNKLFRAHSLSEEKKVKVIETFDRARTLREVKLVYATMAESFGGGAKRGIKESKGSASKAVASTKSRSRKVISEAASLKNRFKKLANINS